MAKRFVKTSNDATVYEKQGGGLLKALSAGDYAAADGGDPNQLAVVDSLNNAYDEEINAQAAGQVDPELNLIRQQSSQRIGLAEGEAEYASKTAQTANSRLMEALSKVYEDRRKNDPLARQGIVSGASRDYETDTQVKATREIGDDLSSKLSYIAQTLNRTKLGEQQAVQSAELSGQQKKSGLVASLRDQYASNRSVYEEQAYQRQMDAQKMALARSSAAKGSGNGGSSIGNALASILAGGNGQASPEQPSKVTNSREDISTALRGIFQSGGWQGKDNEILDVLAADNPGYNRQDLVDLFYGTRKDFEGSQQTDQPKKSLSQILSGYKDKFNSINQQLNNGTLKNPLYKGSPKR